MAYATITGIAQVQGVPTVVKALTDAGHTVLRSDMTTVVAEIKGTRAEAEHVVAAAVHGVKASSTYGISVLFRGA